MHRRIGQLLSEIVPLTDHDVEDILQEQKTTRQRFGDAAMALGMVAPNHVWQAWIKQIESDCTEIDLNELGIDTQIIHRLPRDVITKYQVLPVRAGVNEVVIACSQVMDDAARKTIQKHLNGHAIFVLAHPGQVKDAIGDYLSTDRLQTAAA